MARMKLCEWEHNGYDDSDWFAAVWNTETGRVERVCIGTTRCDAANIPIPDEAPLTPEGLAAAVAWLEQWIYAEIRQADIDDRDEPRSVERGDGLVLTRNARHRGETLPAGSKGRVFWSGAYGRFYRNGYNRPGRHNTRVGLELQDGRRVFVSLAACRRDRPLLSEHELRAKARTAAEAMPFASVLTGGRVYGTTDNRARALRASLSA